MKGKVVLKFNGKTRIRLENGQELNLNNQQLSRFNPALKQGDTGEIYRLPDGSLKFRIDADDAELTSPPVADTLFPLLTWEQNNA